MTQQDIYNIIAEKDNAELKDKVTDKVTDNQKIIINEIAKNNRITTQELSNILQISLRKTKENIAKLKTMGFLQRIGPAKSGYWQIIEPDTKENSQ
ncbi:MAG: winged helix-turn-helix transcriptional regulator [Bacteroidales bacterium]|jgi:ATP-dependent DNA helicase RecG|nr:winged helix-turn-helix transcriptional regulator [Bacteroidales bacterium]